MDRLKEKLMVMLKNENEIGKIYSVSLYRTKRLAWWAFWKVSAITGFMALSFGTYLSIKEHYVLGMLVFLIYGIAFLRKMFQRIFKRNGKRSKPFEATLKNFIYENKYFEMNAEGDVISQIDLHYAEYANSVSVFIMKNGDRYQKVADQLADMLESRIGLSFHEMNQNKNVVEYIFLKYEIERKKISAMPIEDNSLRISVYGDFEVSLRSNFSMLVSGSSGGGKSFFSYAYLSSFLAQTVNGKHARLWAIDPKQSDLYKLFKTSKMPAERYGSSVAEAFKIVKAFNAEMERRQELYAESNAFSSVAVDLGEVPELLVIEEYSSLVATMEAKQKKEFENLVAVIAQKSRQLSMGIMIIMQQPRADSLSTNVREQLVNAVFMGNPSKESSSMMFGTSDVPRVNGIGVGLYSIDKAPVKEFKASIFEKDVFEVILPVWQAVANEYDLEDMEQQAPEITSEPSHEVTEELAEEIDWHEFL